MKALKIVGVVLLLYVGAFVVVHGCSRLLRRAGTRWYYSDNRAIEAVGFYGFWPLRHIIYHAAPSFMSRHKNEVVYPTLDQIGPPVW